VDITYKNKAKKLVVIGITPAIAWMQIHK